MRIAILGGGQLAKMTAVAAAQLGVESVVWASEVGAPASQVSTRTIVGSLLDPGVQRELIAASDVITLESEFIDSALLDSLEELGGRVLPSPPAVAQVQDKWLQKNALARHGLPVAPGFSVADRTEAKASAHDLGYPVIIKTRRLGYDGHGTFSANSDENLMAIVDRLKPAPDALLVEKSVPFSAELSVVVSRGLDDTLVSYPVVQTLQPRFVCEEVWAPAPVSPEVQERAQSVAESAARALGLVGTLAVEMFLMEQDVIINEIAPRPHNSGHFSIEACHTSQFENHVRAVLGLPLGSTAMYSEAAVMLNLLGQRDGSVSPQDLAPALAIPGVHVHFYGKPTSRPLRKLGHLTVLAASLDEARDKAREARAALDF